MDELQTIENMGFTLPSPAYLFGALLFGVIGYAAFRFGKRTDSRTAKWIGVSLMLYPYAIAETWQLYAVGGALCVSLYFFRR